jgi:hypothetical protein
VYSGSMVSHASSNAFPINFTASGENAAFARML